MRVPENVVWKRFAASRDAGFGRMRSHAALALVDAAAWHRLVGQRARSRLALAHFVFSLFLAMRLRSFAFALIGKQTHRRCGTLAI